MNLLSVGFVAICSFLVKYLLVILGLVLQLAVDTAGAVQSVACVPTAAENLVNRLW